MNIRNIITKLNTSTLLLLLIIGIASAAIIAPIVYTHVIGTGTYSTAVSPNKPFGYKVYDGDISDNVTFSQVPNGKTVNFDFPMWNNSDLEYRYVIKMIPEKAGNLTLSNITRYGASGITLAMIEIEPSSSPFTYPYPIPVFPSTNAIGVNNAVVGSSYYVSFKLMTDNNFTNGSTAYITFDINLE